MSHQIYKKKKNLIYIFEDSIRITKNIIFFFQKLFRIFKDDRDILS